MNGLLAGLAFGLGAWGPDVAGLLPSRVRLAVPAALPGLAAAMLLGSLAGWVAGRTGRMALSLLAWLLAGAALVWLHGRPSSKLPVSRIT